MVCAKNTYFIGSYCLIYVFLPILKKELNNFMDFWNTHQIRFNRLARCPSGRPDDLYDMPQLFGNMFVW